MNFARRYLWGSMMVLLAMCFSAHAEVKLSVATDKPEYVTGETIEFRVTAHNSDSNPVTLALGSSPAAGYMLDVQQFVLPQTDSPLRLSQTIPGNSSFAWTVRHKYRQYAIPIGEHTVIGSLSAPGISLSAPATFRVVGFRRAPSNAFVIDFDQIPESKIPVEEIEQYWPWGVEFSVGKSLRSRLALAKNGQDAYLACTSATIPPGLNIVAKLNLPVNAVSADVSSATGRQVTMIAKDEAGNVLGKVVSTAVVERGKFLPLTLESKATPIASIEWWPSSDSSPVMIDNVRLSSTNP